MSEEDEVAFDLTEKGISYDGARYEISIPWKINPGNCVINNYNQTHRRLIQVEKQLQKNPKVCIAYKETINMHIKKGYIHKK